MSKYIGTPVVSLSTDTVDVTGDITTTDATPEVIIVNDTHEDTDGGREGKVTFKGQQSGGEETTLAQIQASHDGTSDDEKGDLIFKTNDGSDGASPTEVLRTNSAGNLLITSSDQNGLTLNTTDSNGGFIALKTSGTAKGYIGTSHHLVSGGSPSEDDTTIRAEGVLQFTTGGATERMRIASDGKVGIGTTTPKELLNSGAHVVEGDHATGVNAMGGSVGLLLHATGDTGFVTATSSGSNNRNLQLRALNAGSANANQLFLNYTGNVGIGTAAPLRQLSIANSASAEMSFISGTSSNASILFGDGLTGTDVYRGYIQYEHANDAMTFATAAAERMRINSSGQFLHGCTSAPTGGSSTGFSITDNGGMQMVTHGISGTSNTYVNVYRNANGLVGGIRIAGSGTNYDTSSDYRLKENVTAISDGITRLKQLKPSRFNFIADADTTLDGFLAHEAQTVVPEAVNGTKDEVEVWADGDELPDGVSVGDNKLDDDGNTIPVMQGIDQSKIVPLLVAALKEAIAKIETLETKVAALEGE